MDVPLLKRKSKKVFSHNVGEMMEHGHPGGQALAVSYHMKRKGMAKGGVATSADDGYQSECDENCNHPGMAHEEVEEEPMAMVDSEPPSDDDYDEQMVSRIMKHRQQGLSKGGKVANSDEIEAGFSPNEFDELHLSDDLESSYTKENSGDETSSSGEDERRRDMVSRIMLHRRKQTNPHPA